MAAGGQEIILERDGHDQPWGFRLQGGSDVGMPLSVQRVLVGTPSEGVLKKGDVVIKISRTDTKGLTHQQAADLFTNVGNQISIIIKRPGAPATQTVNVNSHAPPYPAAPIARSPEPYRTSPLIQPTANAHLDLGPGSSQHLKMQSDYITGAKESVPALDPRASEFTMKQKVTGTLQQIQQSTSPPSPPISHSPIPMPMPSQVPVKQYYNNPINLYSHENVAEVAKLNMMGVSGLPADAPSTSPTGLLHPVNKPIKQWLNMGGLPRKYDPEQSATWQAIHETENCQLVTEHGPTSSKVYSI